MPELHLIQVALRIHGDDLDPAEITRLLQVEPTRSRRKGQMHRLPSGREVVARTGSWTLEAQNGSFDAQLGGLLARLPDDPALWKDLTRKYHCDVFCGLFLRTPNEGADISPAVLSMLGQRQLRLSLDIHGCGA